MGRTSMPSTRPASITRPTLGPSCSVASLMVEQDRARTSERENGPEPEGAVLVLGPEWSRVHARAEILVINDSQIHTHEGTIKPVLSDNFH
jgi:hypothetical protein